MLSPIDSTVNAASGACRRWATVGMDTVAQSRVPRLVYRAVRLQYRDVDAKRGGPMVLGRKAQHCRHRGTGPDGEPWADAALGIVRRSACRPVQSAPVTDVPAVVCGASGASPGSADIPRSPWPGITVDVYLGHWLRFCANRDRPGRRFSPRLSRAGRYRPPRLWPVSRQTPPVQLDRRLAALSWRWPDPQRSSRSTQYRSRE